MHPERCSNYVKYNNEFDFSQLNYPVHVKEIVNFEKLNKNVSVLAHLLRKNMSECLYKTNFPNREFIVHLFLYNNHWMPITNLSSFYREERQTRFYKCERCLKSFYDIKQRYESHLNVCAWKTTCQHETIP